VALKPDVGDSVSVLSLMARSWGYDDQIVCYGTDISS